METVEIAADLRTETGKGPSRRLRTAGRIPVTFYGPKRTPLSIAVDAKEFKTKIDRLEGSHLIKLRSDSSDLLNRVALVRGTQHDPVSGQVLHVDFYEIDLTQKLTIAVPVHYVGKAVGVAVQGGILQPIRREVDVNCLPSDIPEYIEVDVSGLNIHDAVHVSELEPPSGVEFAYESDFTLVTVLPPTVEEVKVEAAEEGAEVAAAPAEAAAPAPKTEGA